LFICDDGCSQKKHGSKRGNIFGTDPVGTPGLINNGGLYLGTTGVNGIVDSNCFVGGNIGILSLYQRIQISNNNFGE